MENLIDVTTGVCNIIVEYTKTTNYSNDGNTLKYARVKQNNNSADSLNHNLLLDYGDNTSYILILNIEYTKTTD